MRVRGYDYDRHLYVSHQECTRESPEAQSRLHPEMACWSAWHVCHAGDVRVRSAPLRHSWGVETEQALMYGRITVSECQASMGWPWGAGSATPCMHVSGVGTQCHNNTHRL